MGFVTLPFKIKKQYRLPGWNYSSAGYYFVTICTHDRLPYFGTISDGVFSPSQIGQIAVKYWLDIPKHFPEIIIDKFCFLPNHMHGILVISRHLPPVGTHHDAFLPVVDNNPFQLGQKSSQIIPCAIKLYKSSVSRYARINNIPFSWQPRFHDRIIRTEKEYISKCIYIKNNPKNWNKDKIL